MEKRVRGRRGVCFDCLLVWEASSKAIIRPRIETMRADNFRRGGIDITGVFKGEIVEVIRSPATMLPQASRLRGLITAGLFSLMGERGLKRGWPIET